MDPTVKPGERRCEPRRHTLAEHGVTSARIRPGHNARVVDVSAGGALVETPCRLLPGTSVEIRLATERQHVTVRGEVVRCAVSRLRPLVYRGAIRFDRRMVCFADCDEYGLPAVGGDGGRGAREEVTRGVL